MTHIPPQNFTVKVSSVLGRDVKSYGKQYLFDGSDETCWNSDQGTPQWIALQFTQPLSVKKFEIQFGGGFAAKAICLQRNTTDAGVSKLETINNFYPDDKNSVQIFKIPDDTPTLTDNLKFVFHESTDTYGRIVIYKINLYEG